MSTLSLNLVPGALPADGDLIDNATLRAIARPTITLEGEIGAASITDGAVTTAKLADGALSADTTGRAKMADAFVTAAKLASSLDLSGKTLTGNPSIIWTGAINFSGATFTPPAGQQVQQISTTSSSTAISTAAHTLSITGGAVDNTVPQNDEGVEFTALATTITPKSTTNRLVIEVEIPYGLTASGAAAVYALFQDSTADALAAGVKFNDTLDSQGDVIRLRHEMAAGTTSATTFKIHVDCTSGTIYLNRITPATVPTTVLGGVMKATMTVREIQV